MRSADSLRHTPPLINLHIEPLRNIILQLLRQRRRSTENIRHAAEIIIRGLRPLAQHHQDGRRDLQIGNLVPLDGAQEVLEVELPHDVHGVVQPDSQGDSE